MENQDPWLPVSPRRGGLVIALDGSAKRQVEMRPFQLADFTRAGAREVEGDDHAPIGWMAGAEERLPLRKGHRPSYLSTLGLDATERAARDEPLLLCPNRRPLDTAHDATDRCRCSPIRPALNECSRMDPLELRNGRIVQVLHKPLKDAATIALVALACRFITKLPIQRNDLADGQRLSWLNGGKICGHGGSP
jgi:hypothetical protein